MAADAPEKPAWSRFAYGQRVRKHSGSSWQGTVVGWYSASRTPHGLAVESEREIGNVQIYPEHLFEAVSKETNQAHIEALDAALDATVPGGGLVIDYFDTGGLSPKDAEDIGVKLVTPGRWYWCSDIRNDEVRDTLKVVLGCAFNAVTAALVSRAAGENIQEPGHAK